MSCFANAASGPFASTREHTLDLNVVPQVKALSHLPVLVDPSHGIGHRDKVRAMARAALACGAHGLLVEAHTQPNSAYTDAAQTIDIPTLKGIARDAALLAQLEEPQLTDAAESIAVPSCR